MCVLECGIVFFECLLVVEDCGELKFWCVWGEGVLDVRVEDLLRMLVIVGLGGRVILFGGVVVIFGGLDGIWLWRWGVGMLRSILGKFIWIKIGCGYR